MAAMKTPTLLCLTFTLGLFTAACGDSTAAKPDSSSKPTASSKPAATGAATTSASPDKKDEKGW